MPDILKKIKQRSSHVNQSLMKFSSLVVMLCGCLISTASHIVGGDLHYEYLGNNLYQVTLKVYRDCATSSTNFDDPASIGVYNSSGTLVMNIEVLLSDAIITDLPIETNSICVSPPSGLCVKEAIFSETVELPPIPGGYTLAYQRCCRNVTLVNTDSNDDLGITLTTNIPGPELAWPNSNPSFNNYPPVVICLDFPFEFDHSATDIDGDQLVYEFCTPLLANEPGFYINPPGAPPYPELEFLPGYTYDYPIDADPAFSIDPNTGFLTGTPNQMGQYVVGICVKEYRDGVLINSTNRDFQFNVVICDPTNFAAIADQTSLCDGLTMYFDNLSPEGLTYAWDFGVDEIDTDTSSLFIPEYTYTDTGWYNITLILNPGLPCADTTSNLYHAVPELIPVISDFTYECDDGDMIYQFWGAGGFSPNPSFHWDFGPDASPQSSDDQSPDDVILTEDGGSVEVTLTIYDSGCEESATQTIEVPDLPYAEIVPQETFCNGFYYNFEHASENATEFYWDFGTPLNDDISYAELPEYTFADTGHYTIMLISSAPGMCPDTAFSEINIYGLLDPYFAAPGPQCLNGNDFNFIAEGASSNDATYEWNFGTEADPPTSSAPMPQGITFLEAGVYDVYLTIFENDCEETYTDQVEIFPNPEISATVEGAMGCPDLVVNFQNNSSASTPLFYIWDFGDGQTSTQGNPTHVYSNPGVYDVSLTVYTLTGCVETLSLYFDDIIQVFAHPQAGFNIAPGVVNILDPSVEIVDNSTGGIDCSYIIEDGTIIDDCNFSYTFNESGVITIEQIVTNEAGCSDHALGYVIVEGYVFFASNSFTPNDDMINDIWKPEVTGTTDYHLQIFNRWGDVIFETTDPGEGWIGNVNGGDYFAQDGVYNYRCVLHDLRGYPHEFNGHISLLR